MSPAKAPASRARIPPRQLLARAARIKLVLLDVDGVLTDGRLYYGAEGELMKAFDVKDGHGIVLLRDHLDFGVISGRPGKATQRRLEELRFKHVIFGQLDKLAGYAQLAHLGLADDEGRVLMSQALATAEPLITALRAAYPRSDILLLGKRWHAELLAGLGGVVAANTFGPRRARFALHFNDLRHGSP